MRREITIGLVLMLALSSITIISGNVSAEIKKEDMTWSTGDKWAYRYTMPTMIFKMNIEVTGDSTIDINGVNYDVYVTDLTGEFEMVDFSSALLNTSLIQGSTITGMGYVAKDNDETAKMIQNLKYQLMEETTGKFINLTQSVTTITYALSGGKPDTIDVGTSWNSTVKTETTTTTTLSGSYFDYIMQTPGYTNTTSTTSNTSETFNYECLSRKNITTDAGTFGTYEIERSKEDIYSLQYFSPAVKNAVEYATYNNDGTNLSFTELISYELASASSPSSTTKTPGFELIIVVCSIAIILLWKRKRMS
jgi:hypothetical protein